MSHSNLLSLTPYDLHKKLINHYVLTHKGSTVRLKRDVSQDKCDIDIIRENHKFLWDNEKEPDTWEEKLAKKYYDKLFKEYCICDLTYYKENKVAMRWQTEQELLSGKGQFSCGEKHCSETESLRTWEVNFGYVEDGTKKNALVKLRLCPECSCKLNYRHKRREIKKKVSLKRSGSSDDISRAKKNKCEAVSKDSVTENSTVKKEDIDDKDTNIWKESGVEMEERSRDEDFEEYLEKLFL